MLRQRSMLLALLCVVVTAGVSAGAAFAGEITGSGKATAGPAHANFLRLLR